MAKVSEQAILEFSAKVTLLYRAYRRSPTLREIAKFTGLSSTATVAKYIQRSIDAGLLMRSGNDLVPIVDPRLCPMCGA